MQRNFGMMCVFMLVTVAGFAAPWATTHSLVTGTVSVTNSQANSVWCPVAVLWGFPAGATATVTAARTSQGHTYLLGQMAVSNTSTVIWVPEAEYPFEEGDVLVLTSTATNGAAQVILK